MRVHSAANTNPDSRIGYVVKRYPRFSETFIVNEIIAHESAGQAIDIFALRPSVDTHFQNAVSQVRAAVTYLPIGTVKSTELWSTCHELSGQFPELWQTLSEAKFATVIDAFQAIQLARHVREKRITHLHAHFASSAATVARIAARIAGIGYSVTMHAKDIFHESVNSADLAEKIADSAFIVTVSEFNRQYLSRKFGFPAKIHRIYNGLDLDVFQFNPSTRRSRRIIAVGRLVAKKGFCYLVDACRILADKGVEFTCEIIGSGELESDLKDQIERLSLGDHVKLSGPQPQNVVREKISNSTVFAAPCVIGPDGNRDGLPTVITESLALGTPCVGTDVTGIPEIIRHRETGILVGQHDSDELAADLERLLTGPETCRALAKNARRLVENEFDIHDNVAQLRDLFSRCDSHCAAPKPAQLQEI